MGMLESGADGRVRAAGCDGDLHEPRCRHIREGNGDEFGRFGGGARPVYSTDPGNDGLTQSSLTLHVTVTAAMPLSVTTSIIFSNIDPVSHMGTAATLVAYVTGGTGPFTYQWSGGGARAVGTG